MHLSPLVLGDAKVRRYLTNVEIEECFSLAHVDAIFRRVFDRA